MGVSGEGYRKGDESKGVGVPQTSAPPSPTQAGGDVWLDEAQIEFLFHGSGGKEGWVEMEGSGAFCFLRLPAVAGG